MLIFNALSPVVLLILLGWALRAYEVIPQKDWHGIQQLGYWVLFPSVLIYALIHADFSSLRIDNMVIAYLAGLILLVILALALLPLRNAIELTGPQYSSVFQTSTRWNAFIALAIVDDYLGKPGLALVAVIMALSIPILNIINVIVVSYTASQSQPSLGKALKNTASNPFLIGVMIGLSINFLNIPVYQPVDTTLELIARAGLGVGLLTVGAGLRIRMLASPTLHMFIGAFYKILLFPLIMLALCSLLNVTGIAKTVAVLCASIPTALNGYVLAKQLGGDADLYAISAALQTLLSFVSIPLFIWLAQQ